MDLAWFNQSSLSLCVLGEFPFEPHMQAKEVACELTRCDPKRMPLGGTKAYPDRLNGAWIEVHAVELEYGLDAGHGGLGCCRMNLRLNASLNLKDLATKPAMDADQCPREPQSWPSERA
jgi:hypothetical protein